MNYKHTPECLKQMEKAEILQEVFIHQHPNHCPMCYGWGGTHSTYDPSPAGVSLGAGVMHDFDPCPYCYEKGLCPHCREPFDEGWEEWNEVQCGNCGWNEVHSDGMPPNPECICWHLI